mmetsp:Transcript_990/g.2121  ORF Transcript_990/g.2121 Transcript_990/m.2121 type:complete len:191 (+) Transcript_990:1609-2181(+)
MSTTPSDATGRPLDTSAGPSVDVSEAVQQRTIESLLNTGTLQNDGGEGEDDDGSNDSKSLPSNLVEVSEVTGSVDQRDMELAEQAKNVMSTITRIREEAQHFSDTVSQSSNRRVSVERGETVFLTQDDDIVMGVTATSTITALDLVPPKRYISLKPTYIMGQFLSIFFVLILLYGLVLKREQQMEPVVYL